MTIAATGIIHGKIVELDSAPALPDGQVVRVTLQVAGPISPTDAAARHRLEQAAGAWSEDGAELDQYLEWNRQQRKHDRPGLNE